MAHLGMTTANRTQRPFRCLLFLGILLATTHPLPAPVTVLPPAATPKPKPTPAPAARKPVPTPSDGSHLAGLWEGNIEYSGVISAEGGNYEMTQSMRIVIAIAPGGKAASVLTGPSLWTWKNPPPGMPKQQTHPGGTRGPFATNLKGGGLEWTHQAYNNGFTNIQVFQLTPGTNARTALLSTAVSATNPAIPGGTHTAAHTTLKRAQ
jgi:hypothetical protein